MGRLQNSAIGKTPSTTEVCLRYSLPKLAYLITYAAAFGTGASIAYRTEKQLPTEYNMLSNLEKICEHIGMPPLDAVFGVYIEIINNPQNSKSSNILRGIVKGGVGSAIAMGFGMYAGYSISKIT